MAKPRNYITQGPNSYTAFASRRSSSVAAAAQHAKKDLPGRNYSSLEDLVRWEGEGGAAKQRSEASKGLRKPLVMKFAIAGRASYDSPHRSYVETMMTVPVASVTPVPFMLNRGPADKNEERATLLMAQRPGASLGQTPGPSNNGAARQSSVTMDCAKNVR